ncbi:MAG: enoyl-CoA hydratase/isomerase family protein [Devosiaceae bacterium]|nr:enoyl-CoA hydratase/isomerase family protein [Devosiaceae bacterium]
MQNEVGTIVENGVAIITLKRGKAINALTPEMIEKISKSLKEWDEDPLVKMILFEGEGARGFCAGGDVRWTREKVLAGETGLVGKFFEAEYKMNLMIATYDKPIIALTHGVVMGGGIGLAGHARYKITTKTARFAMPEAAIGLFCDVGVRSILAAIPRHQALMFMLSGSIVTAPDAIALGLADICIRDENFSQVRSKLVAVGGAANIDRAIKEIMQLNAIDPGMAVFCDLADRFAFVFESEDCEEIYTHLAQHVLDETKLAQIASIILGRCPTSNVVHVMGLDAAIKQPCIASVLQTDLSLARFMGARGDFIEGVRAVLVDKDQKPNWQPNDVALVDRQEILDAINI